MREISFYWWGTYLLIDEGQCVWGWFFFHCVCLDFWKWGTCFLEWSHFWFIVFFGWAVFFWMYVRLCSVNAYLMVHVGGSAWLLWTQYQSWCQTDRLNQPQPPITVWLHAGDFLLNLLPSTTIGINHQAEPMVAIFKLSLHLSDWGA